jgi:hypothetical protein
MSKPVRPKEMPLPQESKDDLDSWITRLYDTTNVTDLEVKSMIDLYAYKGFDRTKVLTQMKEMIPDPKVALHLIVAIALRGPQAASKLKILGDKTALEMRIPASGGKGKEHLTCAKIQAATADIAAFILKRMNVPKRVNVECPGWIQFPSAGSIKLPSALRVQHLEFSKEFSKKIKGAFDENIYFQMEQNAYLDPKLNLF